MRYLILSLLVITCAYASTPWERLESATALADSDREAAIEAIRELLVDEPTFAAARYNLGHLLLETAPDQAAAEFERARDTANRELAGRACHNLALARFEQGRLDDAIIAIIEAERYDPGNDIFIETRKKLEAFRLAQEDLLRRRREAAAKALRLDQQALPPAREGRPYYGHLKGAGGTGEPYGFMVVPRQEGNPALPQGLESLPDGRIVGVPAEGTAGTYQLQVMVTDSTSMAAGSTRLEIKPAPAITTTTLPPAVRGQRYETAIETTGLIAPSWTIGGLPDGIEADSNDSTTRLFGRPQIAGTFTIKVVITDGPDTLGAEFALVVDDAFAPAETTLEAATAWTPYRSRATVRGPAQTYSWSSVGANGLTIDRDGNVMGRPVEAEETTLPVTIAAEDGRSRDYELIIPVNPPPVIAEQDRIEIHRGEALNRQLQATGGTPPLEWGVEEGVLPPGILLDNDRLVGAATTEAESLVTLTLSDRWQSTVRKQVTIAVLPPEEQEDEGQENQEGEEGEEGDENQEGENEQNQEGDGEGEQDQQNQDQEGQDQQGQDQEGEQGDESAEDRQEGEEGEESDEEDQSADEEGAENADEQDPQSDQGQADPDANGGEDQNTQEGLGVRLDRAAARRWLEQLPADQLNQTREMLIIPGGKPEDPEKPW